MTCKHFCIEVRMASVMRAPCALGPRAPCSFQNYDWDYDRSRGTYPLPRVC